MARIANLPRVGWSSLIELAVVRAAPVTPYPNVSSIARPITSGLRWLYISVTCVLECPRISEITRRGTPCIESHHPVERHGGVCVFSNEETSLYVATTLPQVCHGVVTGLGTPKGIDREVGPAPGRVTDGFWNVVYLSGIDRAAGTDLVGESESLVVNIDGDDPGPGGAGNHDGREAHAAATVDGDPVAAARFSLIDYRPEGSGKAAAQARAGYVTY